jgi:hypothetical protein
MAANQRRNAELIAEFDALLARADGPGDRAWEAEMARLNGELAALGAESRALVEESRRLGRRTMVLAWVALAGMVALMAAMLWSAVGTRG